MIQDIAPHVFNNHYENRQPSLDSVVLTVRDGAVLCVLNLAEKDIRFPKVREYPEGSVFQYLFSIDEDDYFMCDSEYCPKGYQLQKINSFLRENVADNYKVLAVFTAYHLERWYDDNRYCGRCGHKTEYDLKERALRCPECGNVIYPRINPAVIVGVRNGDRLLLTKYAHGYGHNALVAGFTEIGETMEETVRREVMEETGLQVTNITYYKSQPWGIAQDILIGYYCDVDGDDTIKMDPSELKYAEWVRREDIVLQPTNHSLTHEMMTMFKNGMK